ncbi:MAG: helix-turn-helix domain-containing protein [Actinomycetes bacterium]
MPGARLTLDEREEIALGIATGRTFTDIAERVGRPTSTVSRGVDRNGGPAATGPSRPSGRLTSGRGGPRSAGWSRTASWLARSPGG